MDIKRFFFLDHTEEIDIETINVSFGRDCQKLRDSIDKIGILSPIFVRRYENKWQLISGKSRWFSSKQKVPALEMDCGEKEALDIYIHDNLERGFNPVECAKIFYRLQKKFQLSIEEMRRYSSLLGLPEGNRVIEAYIGILELPAIALEKIASGEIAWKASSILLDFVEDEIPLLLDLNRKMHWSASKQRDIFTILWEITRKENIKLQEFINQPEIKDLFCEKGEIQRDAFYQKLREIKFPRSTKAQHSFQEAFVDHKIPSGLTIQPTPYFEKEHIHVKFSFKDLKSYSHIIAYLERLKEKIPNLLKITTLEKFH